MEEKVIVSIIMPSYKSERYISEAITSVLNQSYNNWELLIIDDASPDNSNNIINKFVDNDNRVKLIKLKHNSGPAIARNKAIKIARGRYIAFLDSDDIWQPSKLEEQIKFMENNNLAFAFSAYDVINVNSIQVGSFYPPIKITYNDMLKTSSIGCLTAIYDTETLGKLFMPEIYQKQDYGLWLEILKKVEFAKGISKPLAKYRVRDNSISSAKLRGSVYQWKIYRELEKISILKSIYYLVHYMINGLIKYR